MLKMKKINKTQARKAFNNGLEVTMVPHKANPYSPWFSGASYNNASEKSFDELVNNITYYNCNSELGYYLAYYIND